jgi:hypothetical protein
MSKIESEKLINHLKEKWGGQKCPLCLHGEWSVQDNAYELREFHGGSMVIGGSALIPVVPVTCNNCGNTVLINGIIAGLVDREGKEND